MDIGVSMSPGVLEGKLEQADTNRPEAAWNLANWPTGLSDSEPNRLFVASNGWWVGYFLISPEMLYLPEDEKTPYALLFDTSTWQPIEPQRVKRFRGFTYNVPSLAPATTGTTDASTTDTSTADERLRKSTAAKPPPAGAASRNHRH